MALLMLLHSIYIVTMNFIPLSREEQRRLAARKKAKEDAANVMATHSSVALEPSLVVHHQHPQAIEHIIEKEANAENMHVEAVPQHVSSIEKVEQSHQKQDSHVKSSLVPEPSHPHHEIGEIAQSVQEQAPLEEQVSHLTIVSHQEPPPIITQHQHPILIKHVVTTTEVEQQELAAPNTEHIEPKIDQIQEKTQQNMKIEMVESHYEHPLGKDHRDIKIVQSHEEQLTLSQKQVYRRTLNSNLTSNQVEQLLQPSANGVIIEEHIAEMAHPQYEPPIKPQSIVVQHQNQQFEDYCQKSRSTFVRNLDKNQVSQHAVVEEQRSIIAQEPIKPQPLEVVSIAQQEQQATANLVKSKLKRSLQSNLQKPVPEQINIDQIIQNCYPQEMQKSKRSLAPHLEQSEVSKMISINHFEEHLLMQNSTKLKRDLKANRLMIDEPVALEKVDIAHSEENLHMENSLKLKRELKANNQPSALSEKVEVVQTEQNLALNQLNKLKRELKVDNEPFVQSVNSQHIDVAHVEENFAQDHSTKLKRQLKLNNELPVEPAPPVKIKPAPLVLSIPSTDEEYLEHSISKSKRLLSPSNKLALPEEEQMVVVVKPPLEQIIGEQPIMDSVIEHKVAAEPIKLQLEEPQEHVVPQMSESIKLKRNLQPQPPKVSERVPSQEPAEENLKTIDQGMTDSIKLKRNLQAPPPIPPQHIEVQAPTEQIYNDEKTVKLLKRDLPINTIPQPPPQPQQQIIEQAAPIPQLHVDPPAQYAEIELPHPQSPQKLEQDCKSEKSARSDITQGWDDKKQIFKLFKLPPVQPNAHSNQNPVIPRKPFNSLRFK